MPGGPTFNLADLFEIVVDAVPDREAVVCGSRRLTYRALDERANRLAHWLEARGIGAGDHVALDLYNGSEYLEAMLAAFKLRAVPVNVNYRYGVDELRYLLDDADARAVVAHASLLPTLEDALRGVEHRGDTRSAGDVGDLRGERLGEWEPDAPDRTADRPVLLVADDEEAPARPELAAGRPRRESGVHDYETALAAAPPERGFESRSADDLYILYTGGTTGMPKGVMWRHEDVFFAAFGGGNPGGEPASRPEDLAEWAPRARTRCLPASPFMHGTAHWIALSTLYSGGTVVVSPDRSFDAGRLWRLAAEERVTLLTVVGDAFARPLLDALDDVAGPGRPGDVDDVGLDLSTVRVVLSGGAVLSPAVKSALAERLPGALVVDSYGSSETGGQGRFVTAPGAATSGTRFEVGEETAVLDERLRPVTEPGRVGLLARRGRLPLGYYKDPEKTARTFPVVDGVRWAIPGDHAVLHDDGSVTLLGRGSVSINTGGEKVYPEEVEAAVKTHPDVFDAIVVGVPDRRFGERVVAVVQSRPGREVDPAALAEHVRSCLAGYKVPRDVVLVEAIERHASGKADYEWARRVAGERHADAG